jgi:hypothetical protein
MEYPRLWKKDKAFFESAILTSMEMYDTYDLAGPSQSASIFCHDSGCRLTMPIQGNESQNPEHSSEHSDCTKRGESEAKRGDEPVNALHADSCKEEQREEQHEGPAHEFAVHQGPDIVSLVLFPARHSIYLFRYAS